jgi:hypothetical protein
MHALALRSLLRAAASKASRSSLSTVTWMEVSFCDMSALLVGAAENRQVAAPFTQKRALFLFQKRVF